MLRNNVCALTEFEVLNPSLMLSVSVTVSSLLLETCSKVSVRST